MFEYTYSEPCPYCYSENTAYFMDDLFNCMNCNENFYRGAKLDDNKIKKNQLNFYVVQIKFLPSKNQADEEIQERLKGVKDLRKIKEILDFYKLNVSSKMRTNIEQFIFIYEDVKEWD